MNSGESYEDVAGTKARLPVPAVSVRVFRERCPAAAGMGDGEVMDLIEAVAAPMVAQELRRWAGRAGGYEGARMRDRADELETAVQDTRSAAVSETEVGIDEVPDLSFDATLALVRDGVAGVRAVRTDDESAHVAEDKTWELALTWLAENGDEHAKALASEALQTQLIDFSRWYA